MILHIPHASDVILPHLRDQFVLNDEQLARELLTMTDAFTDLLFFYPDAETVIFPYSRLLVDVERFADDAREPMSKVGMGRFYMKTTEGRPLRRALTPAETLELVRLYSAHHQKLTDVVESELHDKGQVMFVDCHSFPSRPLPCDQDQTQPRPDFCIGTDDFHTPEALAQKALRLLEEEGHSVAINRPYTGTLVPLKFYGKDRRVRSIMIEINRRLYMNEMTGAKLRTFEAIKAELQNLLRQTDQFSP